MPKKRITTILDELQKTLKNRGADFSLLEEMRIVLQEQFLLAADDRERFRAIVDNVIDGIITINHKGLIQSFNRASENLFGYEAHEVIGKNVKILMPEPYHSEHDGYLQNYMQSGIAKIIGIGREVQGRRKDGSTFPLFLGVTQIKKQNEALFVGMVRDLTEQKRLEKLKSEFVSTVSHELRTPLTSIRGSLSLIDSGVMGEVSDKIKPLIQIAINNSERLILLINDILDMEKIASGKMDFNLEQADLNELINQAVQANAGYAKEYDIKLSFNQSMEPINVYVDENRIQQVLTNLISNAVKYSPKYDTVELNMILDKKRVRIEVHDNGPGIPEAFKKQIFQKFAQADSSDTKQKGGTGLGLSISKSIVEKFGGAIGFVSPAGKGTTFFFDLPIIHQLNSDEEMPQHSKGDEDGITLLEEIRNEESLEHLWVVVVSANALGEKNNDSGVALEVIDWINKPIDQTKLMEALNKAIRMNKIRKPRILHVEDDADIATLVKILLNDLADIDLAVNKTQALAKLEESAYNLILLDMMLPDGSAEEILPFINQNFSSTPIVLFSAQEVDHALKMKVSKALVKSRTSNTLLVETIKKLLKSK